MEKSLGSGLNINCLEPKENMEKSLELKSIECLSPSLLDKNIFGDQSLSALESSKVSEKSTLVDQSSENVLPLRCKNLTVPSTAVPGKTSTPCELTGQAKIWDMSVIESDMNSPKPNLELSTQDFNLSSGQEIQFKTVGDISSILESGSSVPNQSAAGGESSLGRNLVLEA